MMSKKIILGTLGGMIVLASASGFAAQMQVSSEDMIAREASEGPRGGDRVHTGTHKNGVDTGEFIIAREASEGPRGGDRVHTGTHKNGVDTSEFIIAREASEGPRGGDNERPGDRQRRGGRNA